MIKILPSKIRGSFDAIPSKSLSHRYLICTSLAEGISTIDPLLEADDIKATINALKAFNVTIVNNQVFGGDLKIISNEIDCQESGSTLRFMIPFGLLFHDYVTYKGSGQLVSRPLTPYEEIFKHKAVKYEKLSDQQLPIRIRGKIKGGYMKIKGDVSSQFISGMLMIAPVLKTDTVIEIEGKFESKPYVDLTVDVMRKCGVEVIEVLPFYYIKGSQTYQSGSYHVEGDYSQAAFFLAAGLINDEVICHQLRLDSLQGDKQILEIIKKMNGHIEIEEDYVKTSPSCLISTHIDLSDIPDLGPILFVLAAKAEGTTTFTHYERLKIKESDRIQAMKEAFDLLDIKMEILEHKILIEGKKEIQGGVLLNTHKDHRIFMALAILATTTKEGIILDHPSCINKSYPRFLEDLKDLGGSYEKIK